MIIFDCNGVLVDSERIAAAVAAEEFTRIGIALTPEVVARFFFGRRPADMIAMVETAGRCKLPASFPSRLAGATLNRLRAEVRAMPHAAYALTWLRGPKCLASSSPLDRVGVSLETTGLARFSNSGLRQWEALAVDGRRTLAEVDKMVRNIDRNPSRLLFGGGSSTTADDDKTKR